MENYTAIIKKSRKVWEITGIGTSAESFGKKAFWGIVCKFHFDPSTVKIVSVTKS